MNFVFPSGYFSLRLDHKLGFNKDREPRVTVLLCWLAHSYFFSSLYCSLSLTVCHQQSVSVLVTVHVCVLITPVFRGGSSSGFPALHSAHLEVMNSPVSNYLSPILLIKRREEPQLKPDCYSCPATLS